MDNNVLLYNEKRISRRSIKNLSDRYLPIRTTRTPLKTNSSKHVNEFHLTHSNLNVSNLKSEVSNENANHKLNQTPISNIKTFSQLSEISEFLPKIRTQVIRRDSSTKPLKFKVQQNIRISRTPDLFASKYLNENISSNRMNVFKKDSPFQIKEENQSSNLNFNNEKLSNFSSFKINIKNEQSSPFGEQKEAIPSRNMPHKNMKKSCMTNLAPIINTKNNFDFHNEFLMEDNYTSEQMENLSFSEINSIQRIPEQQQNKPFKKQPNIFKQNIPENGNSKEGNGKMRESDQEEYRKKLELTNIQYRSLLTSIHCSENERNKILRLIQQVEDLTVELVTLREQNIKLKKFADDELIVVEKVLTKEVYGKKSQIKNHLENSQIEQNMVNELESKTKLIFELQNQLEKNGNCLNDLKKNLDLKNQVIIELQLKFDKNENFSADLKKNLDLKNEVIFELQRNLEKNQNLVFNLQDKLALKNKNIDLLKDNLQEKEFSIFDHQQIELKSNNENLIKNTEIDNLRNLLEIREKEKKEEQRKIEEMNKLIFDLEKQNKNLAEKNLNLKNQKPVETIIEKNFETETIKENNFEKNYYKEQNKELNIQLKKLKNKIEELKEGKIENELNLDFKQIQQEEIIQKKLIIENLNNKVNYETKKNLENEKLIDSLREQIKDLKNEISFTNLELNQSNYHKEKLRNLDNNSMIENSFKNHNNAEMEKIHKRLKNKSEIIKNLEKEKSELVEDSKKKDLVILDLKTSLEYVKKNQNEFIREKEILVNLELNSFRELLKLNKDVINEKNKMIEKFDGRIEILEEERDSLKSKLKTSRKQLNEESNKEIESLKDLIKNEKEENIKKEKFIKELKNNYEEKINELEFLKRDYEKKIEENKKRLKNEAEYEKEYDNIINNFDNEYIVEEKHKDRILQNPQFNIKADSSHFESMKNSLNNNNQNEEDVLIEELNQKNELIEKYEKTILKNEKELKEKMQKINSLKNKKEDFLKEMNEFLDEKEKFENEKNEKFKQFLIEKKNYQDKIKKYQNEKIEDEFKLLNLISELKNLIEWLGLDVKSFNLNQENNEEINFDDFFTKLNREIKSLSFNHKSTNVTKRSITISKNNYLILENYKIESNEDDFKFKYEETQQMCDQYLEKIGFLYNEIARLEKNLGDLKKKNNKLKKTYFKQNKDYKNLIKNSQLGLEDQVFEKKEEFQKFGNFGNFEKIEKTEKTDISGFLNIDDNYVKGLLEEIESLKSQKSEFETKYNNLKNNVYNKKISILDELNSFTKTKIDFQNSFFTNPSNRNSIKEF